MTLLVYKNHEVDWAIDAESTALTKLKPLYYPRQELCLNALSKKWSV